MLKAYKYRLYPTESQITQLVQHIGGCRFIYNWALEQKIKTYTEIGKSVSRFDLNKEIPILKESNEWLKEVNSQSLQGMTKNVESAFTKFFREKKGFPKFKSRRNKIQSFPVPQHYEIDFNKNAIKLPKIGMIKVKLHRHFIGKMKTATISKTSTGKYYISILVDNETSIPEKQVFSTNTTIGIDVGVTDFATLSNGIKIPNSRHLKSNLIKLKYLQKNASHKKKGSNNRNKSNLKVALLHERITNQRTDFQHKLSKTLIDENQAIALETLNIKGMMKNHCLAQAISDVSWASFIEKLIYKAEWAGKTILRIGQFEPSSKICSHCGHKHSLKLSDRIWKCPSCHIIHDRDINAAINIKNMALIPQNTVGTTERACLTH